MSGETNNSNTLLYALGLTFPVYVTLALIQMLTIEAQFFNIYILIYGYFLIHLHSHIKKFLEVWMIQNLDALLPLTSLLQIQFLINLIVLQMHPRLKSDRHKPNWIFLINGILQ